MADVVTITLSEPSNSDVSVTLDKIKTIIESRVGPQSWGGVIFVLPRTGIFSPPANASRLLMLTPNTYFYADTTQLQLTVDALQQRNLVTEIDPRGVGNILVIRPDGAFTTVDVSIKVVY